MTEIIDLSLVSFDDDISLNIIHSNICRITECDNGFIHPSGFIFDEKKQPYTYGKWYNKDYPARLNTMLLSNYVCLSLIQVFNDCFQHIPFDTFPKINAINLLMRKYPYIKIIVNNVLIKKMMISFFSLDEKLFMVVKTNEIYKCKKAIYINHIHTSGIHTKMGSWGKDILKPCISSRISTDNKYLVYLSRDGLPKRVFSSIQEKELIEFLNIIAIKNSLELKVINNPKTPDEVIDIINKSHIIIGIHGGAFANMIYCNINTRIVEIIQKDKLEERPCFYYLASSLGLKYTYLEPESFNFEGNVILNMKKTYEILKTL